MKTILVGLLLVVSLSCVAQQADTVNIIEAFELISNKQELIIIDGRNDIMFAEGHIPNAFNIDAFSNACDSIISTLQKEKPYLIYCRTNGRADILMEKMTQLGFIELYEMRDGFLVWEENELPVEK